MLKKLPELLAPAGNPSCALAAFDAGADAIYCGLKQFNARERSENFTPETMGKIIAYAHSIKRKVYVTFKEKVAKNAQVTINDEVTVTANYIDQNADGYVYLAKHKLDENSPLKDGPITIKVHGYEDAVGNVGKELTNKDITLPGQAATSVESQQRITFLASSEKCAPFGRRIFSVLSIS